MTETDKTPQKPRGQFKHAHRVRTKDRGFCTIHPYSARLAIKVMCTECLGFETHPSECTAITCPLFPYRGKTERAWRADK